MIRFTLLSLCLGLWCWGCAGKTVIKSEPILVGDGGPIPVMIVKDVEKYVVEFGDCLWTIAATKYGDAFMWPEIYHSNRDQISDPDVIEVGQNLVIPRSPSLRDDAIAEASAWPPYHAKHRHKR
jgi:hypothetical protein